MNRVRMGALLALVSFAVITTNSDEAAAVTTRSFLLDNTAAFSAGQLDGSVVRSDGSVAIGPRLKRLALPEVAVAWTFKRAKDGSVFIGTGHEGKIYQLKGDNLSVFAETGQLVVSALAIGSDGTLFAGTLPEGRVYSIDAKGQSRELVRLEGAEHVWDLAYDASRRVLFAATGPEGKVFAIDARGRAEVYYDSTSAHVMCLALDRDGALYAGTSGDAVVLRLTGPGRARVLYDFPGNEITALSVREGALAVAANEFPDPPKVDTKNAKAQTGTAKATAPRPGVGKGSVFRLSSDGRAENVFRSDDGHIASVQLGADGAIHAGVGKNGRVHRIASNRTHAAIVDVDERQVLALDFEGPDALFVTGDAGAIYRVDSRPPSEGLWTSRVLDAKFPSRWGQLTWRAEGRVAFQTRSGNTSEPDATWTDWSEATTTPGPIRSSEGRFLQIRARLASEGNAVLRAVRAYYLPQNQRPVVSAVRLKPPKEEPAPEFIPEPSSVYTVQWRTENPDDDRVRYRVRFRAEGQTLWRSMLREDQVLTKTEFAWNTSAVPDGWYVVQVEASDELSNPDPLALRSTAESDPILVDNNAPRIERLQVKGKRVLGRVTDSLGPIAQLEYAVNGGEWRLFFSADQLFDDKVEDIDLDLSALPSGEHIVAIRATDAGGNVGSAEITVGAANSR